MFTNNKKFGLVSRRAALEVSSESRPLRVPSGRGSPTRTGPRPRPREQGPKAPPAGGRGTGKRVRSGERDPRCSRRSPPLAERSRGARGWGPGLQGGGPGGGTHGAVRRPRPPPRELGGPRGRAAARRRGSGADNAGGRRGPRAGRGALRCPFIPPASPRAPPSRPRRPLPLRPLPSREPNRSRRGRPALPPDPSSNHKTSPTPPTKLRSHRAAPGAPPPTVSGQLRTSAAEKNNARPLSRRRRRRLEAAAAEARSTTRGLTATPLSCSGRALAQLTASAGACAARSSRVGGLPGRGRNARESCLD